MENKNLVTAGAILVTACALFGFHIKNKRNRTKKNQMILDWQRLKVLDDHIYKINHRPNPIGFKSQEEDDESERIYTEYRNLKERVNGYITKDMTLWEKANPQWKQEFNELTVKCQYQILKT